jgi:hypothetical protein
MAVKNYNRKVIFKAPVVTPDDQGGRDVTYPANTLETWADIKRTNQYRALEANATALIDSDVLTIRYADGRELLGKDHIVVYDSKEHVIHSIKVIGRKEIEFIVKAKS